MLRRLLYMVVILGIDFDAGIRETVRANSAVLLSGVAAISFVARKASYIPKMEVALSAGYFVAAMCGLHIFSPLGE